MARQVLPGAQVFPAQQMPPATPHLRHISVGMLVLEVQVVPSSVHVPWSGRAESGAGGQQG